MPESDIHVMLCGYPRLKPETRHALDDIVTAAARMLADEEFCTMQALLAAEERDARERRSASSSEAGGGKKVFTSHWPLATNHSPSGGRS